MFLARFSNVGHITLEQYTINVYSAYVNCLFYCRSYCFICDVVRPTPVMLGFYFISNTWNLVDMHHIYMEAILPKFPILGNNVYQIAHIQGNVDQIVHIYGIVDRKGDIQVFIKLCTFCVLWMTDSMDYYII